MIEERASRRADERPTEAELQAIAKLEFETQLARYCDQQRPTAEALSTLGAPDPRLLNLVPLPLRSLPEL